MRIVIAPNSFKGSLDAFRVAQAIGRGIKNSIPNAEVIEVPIADGGKLTVDILVSVLGGAMEKAEVTGPLGKPVSAKWGLLKDGKTAVIEMCAASGLSLVSKDELNPMKASSYGTGQLMNIALNRGCTKIVLGLGGSATIDGGAGILQALGVKLLDKDNKEIEHGGGALADLVKIDTSGMDKRLKATEILVLCDTDKEIFGEPSTVEMFGPQKGATPEMVAQLEKNLGHYVKLIKEEIGIDIGNLKFGGATGGIAAAMYAFFGAKLESGTDLILRIINFDEKLKGADLLITAEGRLDQQTLRNKGPYVVAKSGKKFNLPVIIIVGQTLDLSRDHLELFDAIMPICDRPMTLDEAIDNASNLITNASERVGRILLAGKRLRS